MAHSHYVLDLYFQETNAPDRFRREVLRIEAEGDESAAAEGVRVGGWRGASYVQVRSITSSVRSGDKVIFSSKDEFEAAAAKADSIELPSPDRDAAKSAETSPE